MGSYWCSKCGAPRELAAKVTINGIVYPAVGKLDEWTLDTTEHVDNILEAYEARKIVPMYIEDIGTFQAAITCIKSQSFFGKTRYIEATIRQVSVQSLGKGCMDQVLDDIAALDNAIDV